MLADEIRRTAPEPEPIPLPEPDLTGSPTELDAGDRTVRVFTAVKTLCIVLFADSLRDAECDAEKDVGLMIAGEGVLG